MCYPCKGVNKEIYDKGAESLENDMKAELQQTTNTGDAIITINKIKDEEGNNVYGSLRVGKVIHAVVPTQDKTNMRDLLRKTYINSLQVALDNNVTHIGFSLLSSIFDHKDREYIIKIGLLTIISFISSKQQQAGATAKKEPELKEICLFAHEGKDEIRVKQEAIFRKIIQQISNAQKDQFSKKLKELKLTLIDSTGDGTCMFHSIKGYKDLEEKVDGIDGKIVKVKDTPPSARGWRPIKYKYTGNGSELRTNVNNWYSSHLKEDNNLVMKDEKSLLTWALAIGMDVTDVESLDRYIKRIRDGHYGGIPEMNALSSIYNRNIDVYTFADGELKVIEGYGSKPQTELMSHDERSIEGKPPITLFLKDNGNLGDHYMILFPTTELDKILGMQGGSRLNKQNNNNIKKRKRSINRNNRNRKKRQTTGKKRNTKGKKRQTTGKKRHTTGKKIHRQNKKTHRK